MFVNSCHIQKIEGRAQVLRDLLVWKSAVWRTHAEIRKYTASLSHWERMLFPDILFRLVCSVRTILKLVFQGWGRGK